MNRTYEKLNKTFGSLKKLVKNSTKKYSPEHRQDSPGTKEVKEMSKHLNPLRSKKSANVFMFARGPNGNIAYDGDQLSKIFSTTKKNSKSHSKGGKKKRRTHKKK
jgi:hypothetical protein